MRQARCGVLTILGLCLVLTGFGSNTAVAAAETVDPSPTVPRIDMCSGLNTHQDRIKVKPVARPPYLKAFKEPGFATRAIRITDSAPGEVNKPAGKPAQAWNSDESLLLLHRYGDTQELVLHDGTSYQEIAVLDLPLNGSEDLFWSRTDPDLIYYVAQAGSQLGKLLQYSVSSKEQIELKDLEPYCSKQGLSAEGGRLARPTADADLFAYRCGTRSGKSLALSYRHSTDTISSMSTGSGTSWPMESVPQPFASGQHIWFVGETLNDSLQASGKPLDLADPMQELSVGQDHRRQDAVYQSPLRVSPKGCSDDSWRGLGLAVEHLLPSGTCRSVITQSDNYPQISNPEIFASAHDRPQWLSMSNMGYDGFDAFFSRRQAPLLFSEIFIVDTTPGVHEVCRLAHHRSFGKQARNAQYAPQLGEPNVTQSPSGTRVLFGTDWYDSGFVDTYVIELPTYTPHDVAGLWVDAGNGQIRTEFSQAGQKFSFLRTFDPPGADNTIKTIGNGEIVGSRLEVTYTILLGDDRDIPGECSGQVSTTAGTVSMQCRDHYFGRLKFTLQRP